MVFLEEITTKIMESPKTYPCDEVGHTGFQIIIPNNIRGHIKAQFKQNLISPILENFNI